VLREEERHHKGRCGSIKESVADVTILDDPYYFVKQSKGIYQF